MSPDDAPRSGLVATLVTVPDVECWQLLASAEFGRVGLLVSDRPEVLPVNYAVDGETVLFRTTEGTVLEQASSRVVAFEVDHVERSSREGWSVLVQGVAEDIGDSIDADSERIRRLHLVAWAPGARHRWFRIKPDKVTGRRLRMVPDAL